MRYVRAISVLALLLAFACGSETTGVTLDQTPLSLSVTGGNGQADTVLQQLPDSVVLRVTDSDGNPVSGRLVSFEATGESDCGAWEASALETNANGRVFNMLTFGEDASTRPDFDCTWRAVQSVNGQPDLLATIDLEALPEQVDPTKLGFDVGKSNADTLVWPLEFGPKDQFGNPVDWRLEADSFLHVLGNTEGTEDARTLVADSAGTADVRVIHSDTLLCEVPFTVRTSNWIEKGTDDAC